MQELELKLQGAYARGGGVTFRILRYIMYNVLVPQVLCMHDHSQDSVFASSPLIMACENNQLEVVKTLIENGAMVNYRNRVCF